MSKKQELSVIRHSAAHLLAHAISELYPGTLLTIGPATEEGFFYDVLPTKNFKEEDLAPIAARMQELAEKNYPITHKEISKEEARELYKNNPFKLEIIDSIPGDTVGLSVQGDFYDLCRGGHVASTGELKNFKLLNVSGSYWRADRSKQALQRITGTAFKTAEDLENYNKQREEAALYDHRKLGKQLDLFSFQEESNGFPFFHPKGKAVLNELVAFMRKLLHAYDYQEISTPSLLNDDLWKRSGHYAHYKDNMYFCCIDETNYALKPMNCPGAILVYKNRPRSYRELPLRLAEFGHVHRYELSGALHGLMRVRAFVQDDAHVFCTIDQLKQEIKSMISLINIIVKTFSLKARFALSTRPEKAMGDVVVWEKATEALEDVLKELVGTYDIQPGEGAFYGPKIDVTFEDSLGRNWQCSTIQVDFFQPENFDIHYIASHGGKERPVIVHRAITGSLERFFGVLLEHYKGNLPLWIAPVQARVLPITDAQRDYAQRVYQQLKNAGIRVEIDESSDPLSGQIKYAQQEKIPLMVIVGQKEADSGLVSIRPADGKQENNITLENLISRFAVPQPEIS